MLNKIKLIAASLILALSIIVVPASPVLATSKPARHHLVAHHKPHSITPIAVPAQWRNPGGTYPGPTDPTRFLPRIDQLAFDCIRYHESRDHLVDGYGSQGWYQFTVSTWYAAAQALHLPPTPNQANGNQQSSAAVWYFHRNGRFGVQWAADAYSCPGIFYF